MEEENWTFELKSLSFVLSEKWKGGMFIYDLLIYAYLFEPHLQQNNQESWVEILTKK